MKVIGLERGPRLTTADFNCMTNCATSSARTCGRTSSGSRTWRPNTNANAVPMPVLNNGNQAGGGTVHYGAVSRRMHEDDFPRARTPSSASSVSDSSRPRSRTGR
jgi:choline dehydrogenase-like flavoprotein